MGKNVLPTIVLKKRKNNVIHFHNNSKQVGNIIPTRENLNKNKMFLHIFLFYVIFFLLEKWKKYTREKSSTFY
jgi:hypothetical protein